MNNVAAIAAQTSKRLMDTWFKGFVPGQPFNPEHFAFWYRSTAELDEQLRKQFGDDAERALVDPVFREGMKKTGEGTLALTILLDQIPRNIFRGTPRPFTEFDPLARETAKEALAKKSCKDLHPFYRHFLYMPLEHSENVEDQAICVQEFKREYEEVEPAFKDMLKTCLDFAIAHQNVISTFGRFPHRNNVLGRVSTEAEKQHLESGGAQWFDESPFKNAVSDTPKGFSRIMFKKESIAQRLKENKAGPSSEDFGHSKDKNKKNGKQGGANDGASKKSAAQELRIMPGEKMGEFSRRVDDHMRDKMMKTTKDNTAAGSKKKKYFEKLKAKEQEKKLKAQEEKAYQEYETIHDKIRLNEVAEAPPSLTAVPKKRKNDEFMVNKKWKNTPGEEDFDDLVADVDKDKKRKAGEDDSAAATKKKSRLRNLTPAGRRIMEEERKQAIENYRLLKARKALERNPVQDNDADADDAEAAAAGY
ncbi:hypothetical protein BGZ72_009674 [Mortierella alpina]|nr:hypothetical protein BGZ72_009674 [Mortierella alpina]